LKISLAIVAAVVVGYIAARFFPQPGNFIGLPSA